LFKEASGRLGYIRFCCSKTVIGNELTYYVGTKL